MNLWRVALVGLMLSIIMIQQCSATGQNCYIDNFNNSTELLKNCDNPTCVKLLVLNVTKLANIPNDVINRTQCTESVDVSGTSLQFINHTSNLCQWPKLTFINAEDNNITELQANILSDCHQLKMLSLARNEISVIYDGAFIGLNLLVELDLSNNGLTSISADTFKPLRSLQRLRLSQNRIETINFDNFSHNTKLKVLDLSYNDVGVIEEHSFEKLKELQTLSIGCNPNLNSLDLNGMDKLNTLTVNNASLLQLSIPKSVVSVNADDNKIKKISIEPNSILRNLSLRNNSMRNLSSFSMARQLEDLDISYNRIINVDFTSLMKTNVKKITILENPIHTFNVSTLMMLPKIKMIEISTSRLDNRTLIDLLQQTKAKGIALEDPNRVKESTEIVTLPPVKPEKNSKFTTQSTSTSTSTTTVSPNTEKDKHTTSNSTDVEIAKLLKRVESLESSFANRNSSKPSQTESKNDSTKIEQSLTNLQIMVNCMMVALSVFVAIKLVMFIRDRQWSIPFPRIFSRTSNGLINNRRNPFNDSMDPIIEEVL